LRVKSWSLDRSDSLTDSRNAQRGTVGASALATTPRPPNLGQFLEKNEEAAIAWLTERRERRELREIRNEMLQWAILIVAILGMIVGVFALFTAD
jgi:hypothetical protein